jgi:lysyl-tRNA synthetase class 1
LAEFVGSPLAAVPDPCGHHDSFATHFMQEFTAALEVLGVRMHEVRQSERYPSGVYNASIRRAMDERTVVFDVLEARQTAGRHDLPVEVRRERYYPFKPYCEVCGKDFTTVERYSGDSVIYSCRCSHRGEMSLADGASISGKLVWKADWPMRWVHEGVRFEPAGEDHHTPTGSFNVGRELAVRVFGGEAPRSVVYSFVGLAGASGKMSGSSGGAAIPLTALEVLEPAIVRWLYVRRQPSQVFSIDLSARSVQRLYDEWDRFLERASSADARPLDRHVLTSCLATSDGVVDTSRRPVSFRLLGSAADITQANRQQIGRIVAQHLDDTPLPAVDELLEELEPRLTCAINWATELLPPEERTTLRAMFDEHTWDSLDLATQHGVHMLADEMADVWTLSSLTTLVYGVPKRLLGLPMDVTPSPELKAVQREFFKALYRLLCAAETGPRLPTLLLSIGQRRARRLLVGDTADPGPVVIAGSTGHRTPSESIPEWSASRPSSTR